jgi:hypothetical protein
MPNQQKPNPQHNEDRNRPQPGRSDDNSGDRGMPRRPSPGNPGTERDPYRNPGNQPDVKPDVIADEQRAKGGSQPGQPNPGKPGEGRPGGEQRK